MIERHKNEKRGTATKGTTKSKEKEFFLQKHHMSLFGKKFTETLAEIKEKPKKIITGVCSPNDQQPFQRGKGNTAWEILTEGQCFILNRRMQNLSLDKTHTNDYVIGHTFLVGTIIWEQPSGNQFQKPEKFARQQYLKIEDLRFLKCQLQKED